MIGPVKDPDLCVVAGAVVVLADVVAEDDWEPLEEEFPPPP